MMHYKKILLLLLITTASSAASAAPFAFEARSLGMGNARTATADIATAPFANPGMLSFQPMREDFSLLLGTGGFVNDPENMIDRIEEYQTAFDAGDIQGAADIAQSMENDVIAPEVSIMFSTGFAMEKWSFALSARSDAIGAGTLTNVSTNPVQVLDPNFNILEVEGILTSEIGLSMARNFQIFGQKVSVGLKPKFVKVDGVSFNESISTVDTGLRDLLDKENRRDFDEFYSLDVGLVMGITDHTMAGLMITNAVAHTIFFVDPDFGSSELNFDTQARLGLAYRTNFVTLGLDMDLLENDALLINPNFSALKTRNISAGLELNAFDFAQLRLGAQKNIAKDISEAAKEVLYTAGIGFWFGFNLDLAVMAQDESAGAFLQAGFRF